MITGKIYKIINEELNLTYYGSTTKKLNQRLAGHKYDVKIKPSLSVNEILCYDNYQIILIEELEVETINQLRERERYYIVNFDCVNKAKPNSTRKETQDRYRKNNIEKIKNYYSDVLKERRKTQFKYCNLCDVNILSNNFSSHKKTKKHIKKCIPIINA